MNQYRVVYVEPEKPAVEKKIGTKLEDLQAEVGGLIECIPLTDTDSEVTLVCNDEGKLLNLTPNRLLWNGADYLAGPGFIAGTDGEGNLASLPPQEMNYYAKKFRAFLIAL